MSDRLDLKAREAFRAKLTDTVAHVGALTADAFAAEIAADVDEVTLQAYQAGIATVSGPDLAAVIFADITGRLAESDAEIARRLGTSRQSISRTLNRARKHLGLPQRMPQMSRPRTGGAS